MVVLHFLHRPRITKSTESEISALKKQYVKLTRKPAQYYLWAIFSVMICNIIGILVPRDIWQDYDTQIEIARVPVLNDPKTM